MGWGIELVVLVITLAIELDLGVWQRLLNFTMTHTNIEEKTPSLLIEESLQGIYLQIIPKEFALRWQIPESSVYSDRLIKSWEYIPKRMRSSIEKMNNEKAPVAEILKVLRNRRKRKK